MLLVPSPYFEWQGSSVELMDGCCGEREITEDVYVFIHLCVLLEH